MNHNTGKRVLSMLMALVMVLGMFPVSVFAEGVPETLVTSLTELYSGDETRAREDLEALDAAGLLDENGKLVELDIREDGGSVELSALVERITNGETVGEITVNGNSATSEQIVQISQVKAAIEIAELLDEEIDVTDEHVENLESLLTGIQNGNVDLENALKTGALRLNSPTLLGEGNEEQVDYTLPENTPATLTISEDGKSYIAPYISGSTYIKNYAFELRDPNAENKANYSVGYTGANPQANTATTENNIRVDGFDWAKAIVGVDSYSAEPTVTVILPFKTDDSVQNWIASDFDAGKFVDVSKNGLGIQMDLPGYGTANVKYYFKYMYFEYISPQPSTSAYFENPGIRFPVYLVEDTSTGRYTAVATRFVAPANGGDNPRMDTLSLHVDRSGNTIGPTRIKWTTVNHITYVETDHSEYFPYLPDWSEKSTDAGGNYYWNMKECAIRKKGIDNLEYWDEYASPIPGRGLRYYIPSTLNITSDQYKIRPEGSWEQAKSGFIKLTNPENPEFPYVYPGNVNYPERQYDIELMVTKELYEAFAKSESRTNNRVFVSCLSDELGFVNDAYYPWVIESNNWETYAKCGNARVNSTSSALTLKITLEQDATVSFDYCCETDEFTGDCATFSVDYSTKFSESPEYMQWTNYSCELSAGTHTLTWNYSKDWDDRFDAIDDGFKIKNFSIRTEGEITQPEDNTTYLLAKLYEGDDFNRVALRVSDRRNFSRGADGNPIKNVQWIPSGPNYIARDTSADGLHTATLIPARITPPENVFAYVNRLGFTLTPSYGSQITKRVPFYLTVCEADPFLMVPKSSRIRKTTVGLDTDMMFSSNLAQHNKIKGGTPYQVELYKIGAINMDDLDTLPADAQRIDVPNWGSFSASAQNVLTHITVPGTALDQVGAYAIKITSEFSDGIDKTSFSTIAYLDVRSAPAKIAFEKLASEYCDKDNIPAIRYKLSSSTEETVVKYTVQGSGEESIKEYPASGGTISFTPDKFDGLKKAYIITIYARNDEEQPWSTDSMLLTVYNNDVLELLIRDVALGEIGGSTGGAEGNGTEKAVGTINIDNSAKIAGLVDADGEGAGYQISSYGFDALRSDVGLQRVISANYGSGVWGTISDRMRWTYREASGATSNAVTLNNKENGSYADLRSYSYTSYVPTSDFLIVATDNRSENAPVTITATHANSGMTKSVKATVNTLKDKLYLFRFLPKATTYVTYTNGKGQTRELHSNENGELIVYEPDGIKSDIVTMSQSEGETYVGTIQNSALVSGERNITRLEIYPCNNLSLVPISSQTLTILKPDGTPYKGKVTLRAGVYKRGEYCDQIGVRAAKDDEAQILRGDVVLAASDGVVTLYYDPTQLMADNGLSRGLQYVYEYRVDGYQPGYTIVNPLSKNPSDFIISLQKNRGSATTPQITRQEYRQYLNGTTPTSYIRNVIDYKDNIGISPNFPKAVLYTDVSLPNVTLGTDARGYSAYEGADVVKFALYTTAGKMLTGQTNLSGDSVKAAQITNLSQLDGATYFVFPFSAVPMLRSTYVMTNADMKVDGIDDTAKTPTARVKAVFTRGALTVGSISMPFGITNVSNQPDLTDKNDGAKAIGTEVRNELRETTDIGAIFRSINVNDMIRKGFVFLGNLAGAGGDNFINLMILPTQDPATFRIIAFVGANQRPGDDDDEGVSVNFNAQDLAEDMNKLAKELEDSGKKEDSDSDGEGSMEFNFYGTIILEARAGVADGKWSIAFRGGNVGANVKGKYEWGQTFFCGPYPAFISFEVGFHADLEVAFGNKGAVRAMLLDAALGVSVEAFAGLGFDLSIVAIQLGIYGQIGADVNFLLLTPSNAGASTGTKLTISGEIGIKLKVKLLFISYSKKFASTGFNWTKKWNNYDQIKKYWNDQGFAQLFGTTQSGRAYAMYLYSDGSTIVEINGAAEPESRDYLELAERAWTGGAALRKGLLKTAGPITNALTDVQTNAYPYSHPAFTDDGEIFLYVSDNDNAEATESVASYAVKNGDGYENKGRVDTSEDNILADLDVVASGTKTNAFAAWVKQVEAPRMDKGAAVTNDDLGMMFNATEVYASAFNGTTWNTTRLTDNFIADMSPTVASRGNRAIVAWRSMNASSMSVDGVEDITSLFNVENSINYRIYNGTEWTDARVAYNGNAGTVNAVDSAMLSDGTALIAYTVRTGEDVTTTETFYTVIGADGNILTTGRLTSDSYTDTNAQVTAVNEDGGYFVIGWYSEHDAGEGVTSEYDAEGNATEKAVVAHDVRLARINANGSYDINFPESVGGTGESGITSDFHISAPVNNTDLENVSIVWSQRKNSDAVDDAGKYQLNAVRFFRANDVTGLTAPTDIAETAKNYTIDHFDVYTDDAGAVHAIILGSDYSSIKGIEVYDSIDLDAAAGNTVTSNSDSPKNLDILDGEAISSLKLAVGTFPQIAADVTADVNISEVIPGLTTPVQFNVKNTGTDTLTSITATVGSESKDFSLNLIPNQSATLLMTYNLPEGAVSDPAYSVASGDVTLAGGTLNLNRPDVGISGIKLLREEKGERDIQVMLTNGSMIPLAGSGKTVKLAFYKDPFHENRIGDEIAIPAEEYANIDKGIYSTVQTIDVAELYSGGGEIPEEGLTVYARAWVDETEEPDAYNNDSFLTFQGLLARNNGAKLTTDTTLEVSDNSYTVHTNIRNNSMLDTNAGIVVAVLLDSEGNIIAQKNFRDTELEIAKESETDDLSVSFTADEIKGTPAQAEVRHICKVSFDVNGGTGEFADVITDLDGHITLPESNPVPPEMNPTVFFRGWYTAPTGGEPVTEETFFDVKTTLYAQYTTHKHVFEYTTTPGGETVVAKCVSTANDDCPLDEQGRTATLTLHAPERSADGYGSQYALITGAKDVLGTQEVSYYTATANGARGDALEEAPAAPGKYWVEFTLTDGDHSITAHVVYEIPEIEGLSFSEVTIPEYTRITDPAALNSLSADSGIEALAWIYANENSLRPDDPWNDIPKYIVFNKQYMTRPDDFPPEYWQYEDGVEYAFCYRFSYYDCNYETISVDELKNLLSNGIVEVYIPGTDSTLLTTDAEFKIVTNQEEIASALNPSTGLDATLWALANCKEHRDGIIVLSQRDEYAYTYIMFSDGSADIMNGDLNIIFDMSQWNGMPVFVADPDVSTVLNPNLRYTVTYDANGGNGNASDGGRYYVKSKIEIPAGDGLYNPNLVFDGWNTKADGTGDAYKPGDKYEVLDNTTFYAQWKHVHNWAVAYNEDTHTYTATCGVPGCPYGFLTLHPEAVSKMYDGENARPYVSSDEWTEENGLPIPAVTFYKGGEQVSDGKNVGTYTALVSLDGHEDSVGEFSVTKRPINVTANDQEKHEGETDPELTVSYESVGANLRFENDETYPWKIVTEGDRVYVQSGNGGRGDTTSTLTLNVTLAEAGTLSFDYKYGSENDWDWCRFHVDGNEKFSKSNVGDWQTFSCDLTAGSHTLAWSYSKDGGTDKNGDFFAVDNVVITTDGAVTQADPEENTSLVALNCLIADLRFANDASYPWTEVTEGDRTYAKSGNGDRDGTTSTLKLDVKLEEAGTLSFDYNYGSEGYCDWGRFYIDDVQVFEESGEGYWKTYSCNLSAGSHTLAWSYSKDGSSAYNGDFFAIDNVVFTTEGAVTQEDPSLVLIRALNKYEGGIVEGETLNYTVSREAGDTEGTYVISVTMGENPNYDVREVRTGTLTILESLGDPQTIEASDVTATFGDTGLKINAAITAGDGTLSYEVKSGDAVTVDSEGNLTIVKAGTAVISVVASKTENYARTTKSVNVTIDPKAMTVSTQNKTVTVDGQPHGITVTVTDPSAGYTVKYGTAEGMYNLTASPTLTEEGTLTVYYQVTAENYETFTGSATLTLVNHRHEMSYTVGTGESANTITAVCSSADCPLPNSTAALTISAPKGEIVYDGAEHPAVITDADGIRGDAAIVYTKGGETLNAAPIDAGIYTASITLGDATASVEYEIKNAELTNVSASQNGTLTYTGSAQTPQVTTAATAVNNQTVTFTYSLTEDGEYGDMPTFTNVADGGTVFYKASAANHNDATGSFTVTMNRATPAAPAAPTLDTATASTIRLTEVTGYEYSKDGEKWQGSATFTGLEKSTPYTFYQRIAADVNHNESPASASAQFSTTNHDHEWGNFTANDVTITATCANSDTFHPTEDKTATMTIAKPTLTTYGQTGDNISAEATVTNNIAGINTPTIVYKQGETVLDAAPTAAGTYTASITSNGVTASVTYTIAKAPLTITAKPKTITYGDAPAHNGVTFEGFVNGETEADLGGELVFAYSYAQYGDVSSESNTYTITPKNLTSDNYAITFATGTLTVERAEPQTHRHCNWHGQQRYNRRDCYRRADQRGKQRLYCNRLCTDRRQGGQLQAAERRNADLHHRQGSADHHGKAQDHHLWRRADERRRDLQRLR